LHPGKTAYEDTLGWALYRKGLYDVAVPHLEQAAAQKGSAVPKYHLAMAYAKSGDRTRGRTALDAALKLNPNLPEAKMAKQVVSEAK
jgi:tetratricopeptide (TPR) repeat protein